MALLTGALVFPLLVHLHHLRVLLGILLVRVELHLLTLALNSPQILTPGMGVPRLGLYTLLLLVAVEVAIFISGALNAYDTVGPPILDNLVPFRNKQLLAFDVLVFFDILFGCLDIS